MLRIASWEAGAAIDFTLTTSLVTNREGKGHDKRIRTTYVTTNRALDINPKRLALGRIPDVPR